MSRSWSTVFPNLDRPIEGHPGSYDTAEREMTKLRNATEQCADEFGRIRTADEMGDMRGQAARQLVTLISEINGSLDDVPPVFDRLAGIMDDHGRRLRELERAANEALARARARWDAVESARSARDQSASALSIIQRQTTEVRDRAAVDPLAVMDLSAQEDREWSARRAYDNAGAALRDAESDLEESRREFGRFREQEIDLVEQTVHRIKRIDLGDLKDPNRLRELVGGVASWAGNLVVDVVVGVYRAVEAGMEGRWLDALWHLSETLDAVLTILAVVAVVVAVVATGGSALLIAGLVIGGIKLAADATLAHTQHPHPETGKTRTWGEVAVDAVLLAATVATAGVGRNASLGNRIGGITKTGARGSVISNVRQIMNPVGAAGKPIYGAARSASVHRATGAVVSTVVDDVAVGLGTMPITSALKSHLGSDPLTTDSEAWTSPALIDLVRDSPTTETGLNRIVEQRISLGGFHSTGPSSRPDAPVFQLSCTE